MKFGHLIFSPVAGMLLDSYYRAAEMFKRRDAARAA
jgi:hypothetical protein